MSLLKAAVEDTGIDLVQKGSRQQIPETETAENEESSQVTEQSSNNKESESESNEEKQAPQPKEQKTGS